MNAVTLTETFLSHIFAGDMPQALAMISQDARFIGTRPEPSTANPIFGIHIGPAGAQTFFQAFGDLMVPGDFTVTDTFGTDRQACLYGQLRHTVTSTGQVFQSDWALITEISEGKLVFYHFYEDTAALADAMRTTFAATPA